MIAVEATYNNDYEEYVLPKISYNKSTESIVISNDSDVFTNTFGYYADLTPITPSLEPENQYFLKVFSDIFNYDYSNISNFIDEIGNHRLKSSVNKGGVELLDNSEEILKEMLAADKDSKRLVYENDADKLDFVKQCQKVYKKYTSSFLKEYKDNDYEGNVDEERWYRFAMYLLENGYSMEDISGDL